MNEEMLAFAALKETNRDFNFKNALDRTLRNVPLNKLLGGATDGTTEKNEGSNAIIQNDTSFPEFLPIHCIIHLEHLADR